MSGDFHVEPSAQRRFQLVKRRFARSCECRLDARPRQIGFEEHVARAETRCAAPVWSNVSRPRDRRAFLDLRVQPFDAPFGTAGVSRRRDEHFSARDLWRSRRGVGAALRRSSAAAHVPPRRSPAALASSSTQKGARTPADHLPRKPPQAEARRVRHGKSSPVTRAADAARSIEALRCSRSIGVSASGARSQSALLSSSCGNARSR